MHPLVDLAVKTIKTYVEEGKVVEPPPILSDEMKKKAAELDDETENYNKAAKALDRGAVKPGMTDQDIVKLVGQPVIRFESDDGSGIEWVYKPGRESYFTGNKIYLLFDGNGMFQSWRIVKGK